MNKIAKKYLVAKYTRKDVKNAAIKALRDKEGINVQIGGERN